MLTNEYLDRYFWKEMEAVSAKTGFDVEKVKPILIASEVYIQGAFDAIEEHYGTVQNYLQEELNIGVGEVAQLKKILVTYSVE